MEGKTLTNERRFYPLLVSSSGLEKQSTDESRQVWEQLDKSPINNKKILLSSSIIENLYNAEVTFGWEPIYSSRLAYLVRQLFVQNISQSDFYKALEVLFSKEYQSRFNDILSYINNVILTSQPDPEEVEEDEVPEATMVQNNTVKHTLLDALSKYPNLTNQLITNERIKIKTSAEPARPTLSNWLKNYRDELGLGVHDAVARARFLFESVNTKKLSDVERDRIHALVRSLEDNEVLAIDPKKQEIVFQNEQRGEPQATPSKTPSSPLPPAPDIFERFQTISADRPQELKNVGTQTFSGGRVNTEARDAGESALLSRIKNMKVAPPKANAPAPKEDFQVPMPSVAEQDNPQPLGTLRFSAKHVLPAERSAVQKPENFPRVNKERPVLFKPEPAVPAQPYVPPTQNLPKNPSDTVSLQKGAPFPESTHQVSAPVASSPSSNQDYQPANMFRIKPNRD